MPSEFSSNLPGAAPANRTTRFARELLAQAGLGLEGEQPWDMQLHTADVPQRALAQGNLGLGEAYMDGDWDCEQLDEFFTRLLRAGVADQVSPMALIYHALQARLLNRQTCRRAWAVGERHYDLGNDFYAAMLDPRMTYTCGYWKEAGDLAQAQEAKLDLICRKLGLRPGMRVLDIGCGWGGLAQFMAQHYGVRVVGVTISAEQQKMAQQRCAGLDVEILLQDYRDLRDQFDRIVSVGMFEHVGPKNYATYFDVVDRNLKPDGLFLLHTIGSRQTDNNVDPWINRYIFPNGCLPSVRHIATASESHFVMEDWHNFGADYDRTLMAWYGRFLAAWPEIADNYSERFKRMFSYYLNACAGAFRARDIQLWQVVFSRGVEKGLRVAR